VKPSAEIAHPEVAALASQAVQFVLNFPWCDRVTDCSLAFAIAGVIGVFRVDFVPAVTAADPTVWVIVGDVPPAYIAYEAGDDWQDALRGYTEEMQWWVDAVREGDDLADLIPVNTPPTLEYAEMLATRLAFLRDQLLADDPTTIEGDV
jgi:hypothetical protein